MAPQMEGYSSFEVPQNWGLSRMFTLLLAQELLQILLHILHQLCDALRGVEGLQEHNSISSSSSECTLSLQSPHVPSLCTWKQLQRPRGFQAC